MEDNNIEHKHLCKLGFGIAAAVVAILGVLFFALMGYLGYHKEALDLATKSGWFSLTPQGVLIAALIHGVKGFVAGYIFAFVYNYCPFHKK